jgi:hypothetical protein
MHPRTLLIVAGALALAGPPPARAQQAYSYVPPKLLEQGRTTSTVAGPGSVKVQVLVRADGSAKVQGIIRSTNHGDDRAAVEIAKSSTYRAGLKDGKPILAFYDYELKFTGSGVAAQSGRGGGLRAYEMMMHAGNYQGARSLLQSYLVAHPGDRRAELDLGTADTLLDKSDEAVAAFDRAGQIPDSAKSLAAKAYSDAAVAQFGAKSYDAGLAQAKRAVQLAPSFATYNALGFGEYSRGDYAAATADLAKARTLGASQKATDRQRALVDVNLVSAYLAAGNLEGAKQVAAEVTKLEPSESGAQNALANYFVKKAQASTAAGKQADAAAIYEQGAVEVPSAAALLYAQAAVSHLNELPRPDNDRAKADADKALATDPDNAFANYAAGIALGNQGGHGKDALVYLQKADASAKKAGNANLASAIEKAINQLGGAR